MGGRKFTNFTSLNSPPPKKLIKFLKAYPESKYLVHPHPPSNTDSSLTLHFLFSLPRSLSLPQHKCHRPGSLRAGLSPCIVKHCGNHTPHKRGTHLLSPQRDQVVLSQKLLQLLLQATEEQKNEVREHLRELRSGRNHKAVEPLSWVLGVF